MDSNRDKRDMNTAINEDRTSSGRLAIRLVLTACDMGAAAALVGGLWPAGVMEVPLAAISMPMLLRSAAAILLAALALGMLVAVWSGHAADRMSSH